MFYIGQIVTGRALKKEYDDYFNRVLSDTIEMQPRKGKEHAKYKVVAKLPTKEEYKNLKAKTYTVAVDGLIEDGYTEAEELHGELEEWYDNLPEPFQNGDKGEQIQSAMEVLSGLSLPDTDEVKDITTLFLPSLSASSRSQRANEAASMLSAAASAIREYIEEKEAEKDKEGNTDEFDSGALSDLADQLENDSGELEGVEFPTMYG